MVHFYDNSKNPEYTINGHFSIKINDKKLSYCYIRKNACSAFKKFFLSESPYKQTEEIEKQPLKFLNQYHKSTIEDALQSDITLFVFRPPVERVLSVYKNKFIQMSGNKDIFLNYNLITNSDPRDASFRDFVQKYLSKLHMSKLDAHVIPQISHLYPVYYNAVIEMKDLHSDISNLFGRKIADQYFLEPINVSSCKEKSSEIFKVFSNISDVPAYELHKIYIQHKTIPSASNFLIEDIIQEIEFLYEQDTNLLIKMKQS